MPSRFAALALGLSLGADGARVNRKKGSRPETKFIAGVPVMNYHLAYPDQEARLAELGDSFTSQLTHDWIVAVDPSTTDAQIHHLCQMGDCMTEGHPSEGGVPFFEIRATEEDLETLLKNTDGVKVSYVEPDTMAHAVPIMEAEPEAKTWGLNRIRAGARSSTGRNTHVYVFDTGIRRTHSDFGGRVIPTVDMTRRNYECAGSLSCAEDRDGHGTHCAGSAAGASYGVAPAAKVHAVKTLDDQGGGPWSWDITGLDFVARKGQRPAVVSMSLGGSGRQSSIKTAVDAAVSSGVTVVVAGGNENDDACRYTPAYVPSAITVGSTTSRDARSSFSNYGSCTNIWAPGSDVKSASHHGDTTYVTFSGTSMACPHVSGAALLLLEKSPSLRPAKILERLSSAALSGVVSGLKSSDTNKLLQVNGL